MTKLYYSTVNKVLKQTLENLMAAKEFKQFRLVGGTALSLQLGHRISVDIDLFTDADYTAFDWKVIDTYMDTFPYSAHLNTFNPAFGKAYEIGLDAHEKVKVDMYHTDPFIRPMKTVKGIRLASIEDIAAMKLEVVHHGGRKKDFWDIHELAEKFTVKEMLDLHKERYPYSHNRSLILKNLSHFSEADDDFDPICLRGKYWEFIKEDIAHWSKI
jgi:predicted nucleotidyltransferase component of viral defense system